MTSTSYRLALLGTPSLLSPDGSVALGAGIPVALLAYLVVEGKAFPRDHLATLFWPGRERSSALQSLRQSLFRIRSATDHEILEEDAHVVGVSAGLVSSDFHSFKQVIRAGRVDEAMDLWRGAFLEGFRRPDAWELEEWLDTQRQGLSRMLVAAVLEETHDLTDHGRAGEADALVERALGAIPYDEALLTRSVELAVATDQWGEAEARLVRLQALDPEEDLAELREIVRRGRSPVRSTPSPPTPPPTPLPDAPPNLLPEPSVSRRPDRRPLGVAVIAVAVVGIALFGSTLLSATRHSEPVIAGRGQVLLYLDTRATGDGLPQLYRMNFDGTDKHRLSSAVINSAVWVPRAREVVAIISDGKGRKHLSFLRPDPTNPLAEWSVVPSVGAMKLSDPYLAHRQPSVMDQETVLFSAVDSTGNEDIYVLDAATDRVRRLTTWPGVDQGPSADPIRQQVVFVSYRTGGGDLYSIGLDGSGPPKRLTTSPLLDSRPRVQGDSLLFVRGDGDGPDTGDMELVVKDLRTGAETVLTHNDWNDNEPEWSPDGHAVCWQSAKLGHFEADVWVMDLATHRTRNITPSPGRDCACLWTPAGDGILFISSRTGRPRVFLTTPEGGPAQDLTHFDASAEPLGFMPRPGGPGAPR